ncbi:hypothetical protein RCL1_005862 [Eukaryota sp. TZLM3-RCL]
MFTVLPLNALKARDGLIFAFDSDFACFYLQTLSHRHPSSLYCASTESLGKLHLLAPDNNVTSHLLELWKFFSPNALSLSLDGYIALYLSLYSLLSLLPMELEITKVAKADFLIEARGKKSLNKHYFLQSTYVLFYLQSLDLEASFANFTSEICKHIIQNPSSRFPSLQISSMSSPSFLPAPQMSERSPTKKLNKIVIPKKLLSFGHYLNDLKEKPKFPAVAPIFDLSTSRIPRTSNNLNLFTRRKIKLIKDSVSSPVSPKSIPPIVLVPGGIEFEEEKEEVFTPRSKLSRDRLVNLSKPKIDPKLPVLSVEQVSEKRNKIS